MVCLFSKGGGGEVHRDLAWEPAQKVTSSNPRKTKCYRGVPRLLLTLGWVKCRMYISPLWDYSRVYKTMFFWRGVSNTMQSSTIINLFNETNVLIPGCYKEMTHHQQTRSARLWSTVHIMWEQLSCECRSECFLSLEPLRSWLNQAGCHYSTSKEGE